MSMQMFCPFELKSWREPWHEIATASTLWERWQNKLLLILLYHCTSPEHVFFTTIMVWNIYFFLSFFGGVGGGKTGCPLANLKTLVTTGTFLASLAIHWLQFQTLKLHRNQFWCHHFSVERSFKFSKLYTVLLVQQFEVISTSNFYI